ncbi:MAG: orc1/cdc6 family replication initiation protein [Candidatus Brockarchaeota archaeon]|nr:orc1/cdc6 family replication initiation protein [Candidatus Brockarchaeota archaeon]
MLENTLYPEKLWLRKEEYNRIWILLEMFMESIIPVSMLVIVSGETGSGKTMLAKKIMLDATSMWRNLRAIYLDAESDDRHGLFALLQKARNLNGYSAVEILHVLENSENKFLIVIDNAESIVDKRFAQDLSKIGEGFPKGGFFLLVIFGSKTIPFSVLNMSPPSYPIYFSSYDPSEIRMILDSFLSKIENSSMNNDEALDMISTASGGDASLALSILKLASSISGGKPICKKQVLEALRKISENPFIRNINRVNDPHATVILKVLSQYPQGVRLRKLFEEYSKTCTDNRIRPLRYTQLWKKIRILERKMLLDFQVVNLKRGRTSIVRASCLNGETAL